MALSQLKSVQFDQYIPFATTASGTVDFGASNIVTSGGITANSGSISDVSFYCGAITASNVSANNGISVGSSVYIDGSSASISAGVINAAYNLSVGSGVSINASSASISANSIFVGSSVHIDGSSASIYAEAVTGNTVNANSISVGSSVYIDGSSAAVSANRVYVNDIDICGKTLVLDDGYVKYYPV